MFGYAYDLDDPAYRDVIWRPSEWWGWMKKTGPHLFFSPQCSTITDSHQEPTHRIENCNGNMD